MSRRIPGIALTVLCLGFILPMSAFAQDDEHAVHKSGGIGFHESFAPLGIRHWFGSQKVGLDLGAGFSSDPSLAFGGEHLRSWALSAGVPIVLSSWPRVHVLFRPGVTYRSQQVEATAPPSAFATESEKTLNIKAEIEGEAFILENFSVSASTGLGYESFDPGFGLDKENSFRTFGGNWTEVGFHIYLLR